MLSSLYNKAIMLLPLLKDLLHRNKGDSARATRTSKKPRSEQSAQSEKANNGKLKKLERALLRTWFHFSFENSVAPL
jgi:hypothetical protein